MQRVHTWTRLAVVVVVLGALALVGGSGWPASASAPYGPKAPRFTHERVWNANVLDWEPTVAADPSSSYVYQMTTRYGGPKICGGHPALAHCVVFRASSDGGVTWGPDHIMCLPCDRVNGQNDPEAKVAADGTVYAAWMNNYTVVFSKSHDHGATWTRPIGFRSRVGLPFSDKPILLISPTGKDVYLAFNASDSYVAVSHDYGAAFAQPVKTNHDGRYWFAEGGAVAPDGTVYFAESAEHQNSKGTVKLWVLRSHDGGATWQQHLVETSQQQPACYTKGCYADYYGSQINLAVDSAGTIMVEYAANFTPKAPLSMFARTSRDGVHFGPALVVSNLFPAPAGVNPFRVVGANFPAIAAGPTPGDFRIAWQQDFHAPRSWNTWFRRTTNGGRTWSPAVRLSDLTSGAYYKGPNGYGFPDGDYFGLAVDSAGTNYVVWGESLNYAVSGGTWFTRSK